MKTEYTTNSHTLLLLKEIISMFLSNVIYVVYLVLSNH
uniref:Uncharacterized protein n=1 Tax=Podoviridae sp. ctOAf25 TaxID=2825245 RepID=A0A8S5PMS2_9CAUD|nr:MAG TPA: hypothetical protein [Podoviridae sp. ctOAf25]